MWAYNGLTRAIIVVSVESQPTNAASTGNEDKGDNGSGYTESENKENIAPPRMSGLLPSICGLFLLLATIL